MNPRRIPHVDRPNPADPLQAKFSVQFTAAAALLDGTVGLGHFTPDAVARADIKALAAKVRLAPHPGGAEALDQPCRITVTLQDDTLRTAELPGPRGRDPATYAMAAERKFLDCATRVLPPAAAVDAYAALRSIGTLPDIRPLMARLAAPAAVRPLTRTS
jgi:2-methylcitrate dehydratase PrpD